MRMKENIHIETLGCRLNQIESESAAKCFSESGFDIDMNPVTAAAVFNKEPLLCIVNTCTVTGKAEQKARRIIRLLLRKFPETTVLVTGCYAQMEQSTIEKIDRRVVVLPGQRKDLLVEIPHFLVQFATAAQNNISESLPLQLKDFLLAKHVLLKIPSKQLVFKLATDTFHFHSRSSIKIQDGCNNSCTFCRIHLARGKSVSLDVLSVLDRVKELEQAGHHEVVITTVNIAQYRGAYKNTTMDFADLLKFLLEHTKAIYFRMSSLYPEIVDNRLCALLKNKRVQPFFHLSVQSGSDRILEKMNRKYPSRLVLKAVNDIRKVVENPFMSCDIIVGFPGETKEDFELTMQLCRECNFSFVHVFPFSPRPDTPAYTMRPLIANNIVKERVAELTKFAHKQKIAYITSCKGNIFEAITETSHNTMLINESVLPVSKIHAVTSNFIHVEINYPKDQPVPVPGSNIKVRIVNALEDHIYKGDEIEAEATFEK